METNKQSKCGCENAVCGCGSVAVQRCTCGEKCACQRACRCGGGCKCKAAK